MPTASPTMLAARLHAPRDLRLEHLPRPAAPGPGEILLRVKAVGICGSDLHTYADARIGDTALAAPLILGHEFAGIVEAVGGPVRDGEDHLVTPGTPVAVDPAQPCLTCDLCQQGHPNLCPHIRFLGLSPHDGTLCQYLLVPAHTCFPIPERLDFGEATLLETLGVAIHAVDLAKIRVGDSVAILGAGPVGLCILQLAKLAGAHPIYVADPLPWRQALAQRLGATLFSNGPAPRDLDIAIEAAWAGPAAQQAMDLVRPGGRVVLVGIPADDRLELKHSTARRKGLTLKFSRRMKHTYPRALALAERGAVDLRSLITHRFPLERTSEAFALNAAYRDNVVKAIIDI